jgi:hypothetical protein
MHYFKIENMIKMILTHIEDGLLYVISKIKKTSLYVIIRSRILPFLTLIITTMIFHGCVKDDLEFNKLKETNWSPEIAVPLAYSSMSISDLMKTERDSGILIVGTDNFCTLVYSERALEIKANELFSIPNQQDNYNILLNDSIATALNHAGAVSFTSTQVMDFSMSQGMLLDSLVLKEGQLGIDVTSGIPANITLSLTIPGASKNGIPFSQSMQLNYTGALPVQAVIQQDMSGYKMDLTNGGSSHNQVRVNYTVSITPTGTAISATDKIIIKAGFTGNKFGKLFGYAGQQTLMTPQDTLIISLFNSPQGIGSFTIANPEIKFDFKNSFGFPVRARVAQMTGLNGNLTNLVVANGIPDPLPVVSPSISQIGQTMTGSFTMNNANSNVNAMIANQPKYLISQVENMTNPNGNTGQNFILDTSKFAVDMEVTLPLYGTAKNFVLNDTVDFTYSNLQNIQSLMIRTTLENGFPFDTKFQIYFADNSFHILDSLVYTDPLLMPSAAVDPVSGKVTSSVVKTTDHTLDRSRILKIMNAKKLILRAGITSSNNGNTNVKIYSDYKFNVNLGAIAKVTL